jgi:hypothetical protein
MAVVIRNCAGRGSLDVCAFFGTDPEKFRSARDSSNCRVPERVCLEQRFGLRDQLAGSLTQKPLALFFA